MARHIFITTLRFKPFYVIVWLLVSSLALAEEPMEWLLFDDQELVVTATKREQRLSEAPATVRVIRRRDIENWDYKTLDDVLRARHEIDITNNRVFTIASIRGYSGTSGSERVLFLLDGRPMNDAILGFIEPKAISLTNIERIEIMEGPASSLYGASAFAGVIHLISRSPKEPLLEMEMSVGANKMLDRTRSQPYFDTGGMVFEKLAYASPFKEDMNCFLSISHLKREGARSNNDLEGSYLNGKFELEINSLSSLIYSFGSSQVDMGLPEYYNPSNYDYVLPDQNERLLGRARINSDYFFDITYRKEISPESSLLLRGYYNNTTYHFQLPSLRFGTPSAGFTFIGTSTTGTPTAIKWGLESPSYPGYVTAVELQYHRQLNYKNRFSCGLERQRNIANIHQYTGTDSFGNRIQSLKRRFTADATAVYLNHEFKPSSYVIINGGGRYDKYNSYNGIFSPRLGITYRLKGQDSSLSLYLTKAFRPPDFSEQYNQQYFMSALVQGNDDLIPEKNTSAELKLHHNFSTDNQAEISIFKDEIKDMIDFPYTEFIRVETAAGTKDYPIKRTYLNQASAKILGLELSAKKRWTPTFSAFAKATFLDTEIGTSTNKQRIYYIPENKFTLGLAYQWLDRYNLELLCTRIGKRLAMKSVRHPLSPEDLAAYTILNASFRWEMNNSSSLFLIAENLLDEDYEEGPDFMTEKRRSVQLKLLSRL